MHFLIKIISYLRAMPWRNYGPVIFFLGGFLLDAFTIGRQVQQWDLILLAVYLFIAGGILWWLAHRVDATTNELASVPLLRILPKKWREPAPYFVLQFLFGGLLSCLFILYFKSASHFFAFTWSILLGCLLVANEHLEKHYQKHTVSWTMFGFCAILLFNFLLPTLLGSLHWFWFVLSTLAGAGLTHIFYKKARGKFPENIHESQFSNASITPTWVVAVGLLAAYYFDFIPPVPLVKLDTVVGTNLNKSRGEYQLNVDNYPWWQFWHVFTDEVHVHDGERLYFLTSVFAPQGLHTRLFHRWEFKKNGEWNMASRIGFTLSGGRSGGFRGYTYKQNLQSGKWRVVVETEEKNTLSSDEFTIVMDNQPVERKQIGVD